MPLGEGHLRAAMRSCGRSRSLRNGPTRACDWATVADASADRDPVSSYGALARRLERESASIRIIAIAKSAEARSKASAAPLAALSPPSTSPRTKNTKAYCRIIARHQA